MERQFHGFILVESIDDKCCWNGLQTPQHILIGSIRCRYQLGAWLKQADKSGLCAWRLG